MKLGYLGPPGSYSYEAACLYAAGGDLECVPLPSFSAVVEEVEQGRIAWGILPVENSTYGAVATAMDLLLNLNNGAVCGETVLNIEHCLLGTGSGDGDIQYVYSHHQALEQCRRFFSGYYPHIGLIPCLSTSQACELALKSGPAYGAVASKAAARLYRLPVLAESIQDNAFNQTRFLIIGHQLMPPTGADKTSIAFAFFGDRPGSLFSILQSFADRDINLTRIESRPAQKLLGEYIFYVDFAGHAQAALGDSALREIGGKVRWLKVLGSYPLGVPLPRR